MEKPGSDIMTVPLGIQLTIAVLAARNCYGRRVATACSTASSLSKPCDAIDFCGQPKNPWLIASIGLARSLSWSCQLNKMSLTPGTTLGPYSVTAKIGEGGMGEVYRARDTKLDRDVALKVLPQAFTDDPDRLARFEREAKVLASLNHPNIGHIYGLEEAEGQKALVLELVEGPTLAERIKQWS